jgi:hypothetical protein
MAPAASTLERTSRAIAAAGAMTIAVRAPWRLAQWRLRALDRMLEEFEQLRLHGERELPLDLRETVVAFARTHDPLLLQDVSPAPTNIARVHDALFEAQGRIMFELARMRRGLNLEEFLEVYEAEAV